MGGPAKGTWFLHAWGAYMADRGQMQQASESPVLKGCGEVLGADGGYPTAVQVGGQAFREVVTARWNLKVEREGTGQAKEGRGGGRVSGRATSPEGGRVQYDGIQRGQGQPGVNRGVGLDLGRPGSWVSGLHLEEGWVWWGSVGGMHHICTSGSVPGYRQRRAGRWGSWERELQASRG